MKNSVTTKSSSYFSMALIMFIGLIYNVIEQDFFGSGVFFNFISRLCVSRCNKGSPFVEIN